MSNAWSDEKEEKLKKLWAEGLKSSECAPLLGVTRASVCGKVTRLGLTGRAAKKSSTRSRFELKVARDKSKISRPKQTKLPTEPLPPKRTNDIARKTLVQLDKDDCRFPIDLASGGYGFCAAEKLPGLSYCIDHARRCHPALFVTVTSPAASEKTLEVV